MPYVSQLFPLLSPRSSFAKLAATHTVSFAAPICFSLPLTSFVFVPLFHCRMMISSCPHHTLLAFRLQIGMRLTGRKEVLTLIHYHRKKYREPIAILTTLTPKTRLHCRNPLQGLALDKQCSIFVVGFFPLYTETFRGLDHCLSHTNLSLKSSSVSPYPALIMFLIFENSGNSTLIYIHFHIAEGYHSPSATGRRRVKRYCPILGA